MNGMDKMGMKGRKWDLFLSAIYMFSEYGYDNVTLKDIAKKNYIQAPAIYNHFKSKDDLLETIYTFFHINWVKYHPSMDDIMSAIPYSTIPEIMHMLMFQYSDEVQAIMDKIMLIAADKVTSDKRAYNLIREHIYDEPAEFLRRVFGELIALNRIEHFDIESLIIAYTHMAYSLAIWNDTPDGVSKEQWAGVNEMIFSAIKEKNVLEMTGS